MTFPPPSKDPIGEALHFLRMSGIFYTRSEFRAPWGLALPVLPDSVMFHVVTAGEAWLEVAGLEPRLLRPGEFALVPHGQGHCLVHELGAAATPLFDLPRQQVSERYEILYHGGKGTATHMICGAVQFDHPAARHLLALLPALICIDSWSSPQQEWFQSTLHFLAAEARTLQPGGEAVITRLADILVVQAIRVWLADAAAAQMGWLGALQDPQIGRTIVAIHQDPSKDWTVGLLAQEAMMSRSAFSARFTALVGEPAMQYVTRWRMYLAHSWLHNEHATLGELALRLGYESEAAFNRAFKRVVGVSPGAVRRNKGEAYKQ